LNRCRAQKPHFDNKKRSLKDFFLNGGHKEATLELLARKLYNNLRDKNNIIFFENLKLLKIA